MNLMFLIERAELKGVNLNFSRLDASGSTSPSLVIFSKSYVFESTSLKSSVSIVGLKFDEGL